jgi:putative transposase
LSLAALHGPLPPRLPRHARRDQHGLLAALIRPIFQADSGEQARDRLSEAVAHLDGKLPKVVVLLEEGEQDILAFYSFPAAHWSKLRSTNPLERFNKEIGRRTDVVGIFPDDRSLIRLIGMLCLEQNDEWLVGRRYLAAAAMSRFSRSGSIATPLPTARRS